MTEPNTSDTARRAPLSRAVVTLLLLGGFLLLLPGLCALYFIALLGREMEGSVIMIWVICFAISAGGIAMIVRAARG
jgi:hypothetical protein